MKTNPRFRFENIGPVDSAEIELGDLTVLAGRNNTGKTYLVYALYGFLKRFRSLIRNAMNSPILDAHISEMTSLSIPEITTRLVDGGRLEWKDDHDMIEKLQSKLLQEMCLEYSKSGIPRVFNTSSENFKNTSMGVKFSNDLRDEGAIGIPIGRTILWCEFEGAKVEVHLKRFEPEEELNLEHEVIYREMKDAYLVTILRDLYSLRQSAQVLSSARLSISLFLRELDYARSQMIRSLQQMEDDQSGLSAQVHELVRQTSRYALPIQDNIDFIRDLPNVELGSAPKDAFLDIVNMVGGRLEIIDDDVRFISRKGDSRSFDIPLHLASSSVGEMTTLYFFLNQLAEYEDYLLIIDEPESHLDTANQIQFARLLASLVRSGVRVLITTHSDYLIKEINNLIMLDGHFEDKEEVMKRLGYLNSLDPKLVRAYVAENNTLTSCKIDQFGIDMPVFDKTIDEINKVSNELASRLAVELEE